MEQLLIKIGVDTELLNQEEIHTRENALRILGVSDKTLKKYEDENILQSARFRRKKYYTSKSIIDCIKSQFNLSNTTEWDNVWD